MAHVAGNLASLMSSKAISTFECLMAAITLVFRLCVAPIEMLSVSTRQTAISRV